ncbi:hypothetical protein FXO37_34451 [Capsicum annuum]|nr:hypothetical protein FXO37_34451 [Capsicum annuum]
MLLFMNVGMEKLGSSHSFVICTNDPQKYFMHAFPGKAKGISYAFCFLALFAIQEHLKDDKENDLHSEICKLLDPWLMEVIFPRSGETEDVIFKLGDYYDDPTILRYLERLEGADIARIRAEAIAMLDSVKASAIQAL